MQWSICDGHKSSEHQVNNINQGKFHEGRFRFPSHCEENGGEVVLGRKVWVEIRGGREKETCGSINFINS